MVELFTIVNLLIMVVGLHCAHKLDNSYSLGLRIVIISPSLNSIIILWLGLSEFKILPNPINIIESVFILFMYSILALTFDHQSIIARYRNRCTKRRSTDHDNSSA